VAFVDGPVSNGALTCRLESKMSALSRVCYPLIATLVFGCNSMIGLSEFEVEGTSTNESQSTDPTTEEQACSSHDECTAQLSAMGGGEVLGVCVGGDRCVPLLNEDCSKVTGDPTDDRAIFIGSMFSLTGPQAATNLARQQSAALAVEQINAVGGVPANGDNRARKLVMVSCDEVANLDRAAKHLIEELEVPAIVGPNTSADTLRLSTEYSIPGKTLVMTPTGVASSIADLVDEQLTYQMAPTDVQRAGLMIDQLNSLEASIKAQRQLSTVKLGIVFRNDALGSGTRTALNDLTFNGKSLVDAVNFGNNVQIDPYAPTSTEQGALVQKYVEFAPEIIVIAGTAEVVTQFVIPLEAAWTAQHRPVYVGIDSVKVPELVAAADADDDFRARVRGTGIVPEPESKAIFDAFTVDYKIRYPGEPSSISGMGASYDAVFAIAFGMAASADEAISGPSISSGIARLSGGRMEVPVGATDVLAAFRELQDGGSLTARGTFAPLEWNSLGTVVGSTLEMWCIGRGAGKAAYKSSGLTYGLREGQSFGSYAPCSTE
jgi:ABC-type branched-subunit amino acid transport system substrate-binding protein